MAEFHCLLMVSIFWRIIIFVNLVGAVRILHDWFCVWRGFVGEEMTALPHIFHDLVLKHTLNTPALIKASHKRLQYLSVYCVESVLDLGCGLGELADIVSGNQYLGIDFSTFACKHARVYTRNPNARFMHGDLTKLVTRLEYDTIVLSEVLDCLDAPEAIVDYALHNYQKRLIVTLPVNSPGIGKVKGTWAEAEVRKLMSGRPGKLTIVEPFANNEWWLAMKEKT